MLAESTNYTLGHSYESVFVVDKRDGSVRPAGDHYGDPSIGIVTQDERWFCTGGEGVQCFALDGTLLTFFREGQPSAGAPTIATAWFVRDLVLTSRNSLEVSFDLDELGTWTIDLSTACVTRQDPAAG